MTRQWNAIEKKKYSSVKSFWEFILNIVIIMAKVVCAQPMRKQKHKLFNLTGARHLINRTYGEAVRKKFIGTVRPFIDNTINWINPKFMYYCNEYWPLKNRRFYYKYTQERTFIIHGIGVFSRLQGQPNLWIGQIEYLRLNRMTYYKNT